MDKDVTVQGIAFSVPKKDLEGRLGDWDVIEGIATTQDDSASEAEKMVASVRIMRRVFGADYEQIKAELRSANGGVLNAEIMAGFLAEVFKELAPNS